MPHLLIDEVVNCQCVIVAGSMHLRIPPDKDTSSRVHNNANRTKAWFVSLQRRCLRLLISTSKTENMLMYYKSARSGTKSHYKIILLRFLGAKEILLSTDPPLRERRASK